MIRAAIAAALLLASPVQAQNLRSSIQAFCNAIRGVNREGMPAAPGTVAAVMIAHHAKQSAAEYRNVWIVAKSSDVPACRSIY
jgi:hypothetical protein